MPTGLAYIEPHPRRVQGMVSGHAVIDTEGALLVHRAGRALAYAFPIEVVGDLPHEPEAEAPGYVQVPWGAVDAWYEEGRELRHYPPNPYHRVDCRPTRRHLTVAVAGELLVDTDDTVILFETALAPKLYVDRAHLRADVLQPSDTASYCNYKGDATYWAAVVSDTVVEDVAWSYEDPLPESLPIAGLLSFDPTRVELQADLPGDLAAIAVCSTECAIPTRRRRR